MEKEKYIVCAGGVNYDIHSRIQHEVIMGDSNISHVFTGPGGVARNIAENLAELGNSCVMLSAVGDDGQGRAVVRDCEEQGIDCSRLYVSKEYPTSVYLDILGPDGDMCLATNDMRILDHLPDNYFADNRELILGAAAVVVDANLSERNLRQILEIAAEGSVSVYADPVSTVKGGVFSELLGELCFLKPNRMELEMLSGISCSTRDGIENAARRLISAGLREIAVSLGADGCFYINEGGEGVFAPAIPVKALASATGAGDSFMAGYIDGRLRGLDIASSVDFAQGRAALAVQSLGNSASV